VFLISYTVVFSCGTAAQAVAATTTPAVTDATTVTDAPTTQDTSVSTCRPGFVVSIVAKKD